MPCFLAKTSLYFDDGGHVDVVEGGEQRGVVLRGLEALGDRLAQARHLDAFLVAARRRGGSYGACCLSRRGRLVLGRRDHVVLGDAAVLAGALDGRGVDSVFQHGAAHRGRENGGAAGGIVAARGRGRRGGRSRSIGFRRSLLLRRRGGARPFLDRGDQRADGDSVAFGGDLLAHHAVMGGHDVDGDLVGLEAGDGFVGSDGFAGLLEPLADGGLGDGFAERGDLDFGGHDLSQAFCLRRSSERTERCSASATSAACSETWRLARPVAGDAEP